MLARLPSHLCAIPCSPCPAFKPTAVPPCCCCHHAAQGLPHRSSLRILAQRLLGRTIQQGAHDSFVDAEMALQAVQVSRQGSILSRQALLPSAALSGCSAFWIGLHVHIYSNTIVPRFACCPLQLKIRHGPTFGTAKEGSRHLFELLAARGRRLALVAPRELLMLHAVPQAEVVPASSDRQAVAAALAVLGWQQEGPPAGAAATGAAAAGAAAGAPTSLAEHAVHAELQQQKGNQGPQGLRHGQQQRQRPPPDLLWLHLRELWGHMEGEAQQLAAQVSSTGAEATHHAAACPELACSIS